MKKYEVFYKYDICYMAHNIAEEVAKYLNSGDYSDLDEAIFEEIDRVLIYYDNQWEILKEYCTPEEADLHYAIEQLTSDVYYLINEIEEDECEEDDE